MPLFRLSSRTLVFVFATLQICGKRVSYNERLVRCGIHESESGYKEIKVQRKCRWNIGWPVSQKEKSFFRLFLKLLAIHTLGVNLSQELLKIYPILRFIWMIVRDSSFYRPSPFSVLKKKTRAADPWNFPGPVWKLSRIGQPERFNEYSVSHLIIVNISQKYFLVSFLLFCCYLELNH